MTDIKKSAKESGKKAKKLQLNKETIQDLGARAPEQIKGGQPARSKDHARC